MCLPFHSLLSCLLQGATASTELPELQRGHLGDIFLLIPSSGTGRLVAWACSSSHSSASIYWQGRVKSHISRVQGSPAAGLLPAHEDNKHLMNELPESASLQWKNNTSGTAMWLKTLFFQ